MLGTLMGNLGGMAALYTISWDTRWWCLGHGMPVRVGLPKEEPDLEGDKGEGEKEKAKEKDDEEDQGDETPKGAQAKGAKGKVKGKVPAAVSSSHEDETPAKQAAGRPRLPHLPPPPPSRLEKFAARMRKAGLLPPSKLAAKAKK